MAFQSVPDTALFVAEFQGPDGIRPSFGLYSRNLAGPWDASQLAAIAGDLRTAITDDYMPVVSNELTFVQVTSRDLEVEFGRYIEHGGAAVVGGVASPALPAHVSVVATFIGEPGAAPSRGRINLLPPTESQVEGTILNAGAVEDLQDAADALHNAMSATGPAHVIVSRFSGTVVTTAASGKKFREPVKRAVAVTNTVPTVIVRNRLGAQRKRRPAA